MKLFCNIFLYQHFIVLIGYLTHMIKVAFCIAGFPSYFINIGARIALARDFNRGIVNVEIEVSVLGTGALCCVALGYRALSPFVVKAKCHYDGINA